MQRSLNCRLALQETPIERLPARDNGAKTVVARRDELDSIESVRDLAEKYSVDSLSDLVLTILNGLNFN